MMTITGSGLAAIPESFWRDLAEADMALLMLDYDGTLAPFRAERERAMPYDGARERVERLVRSGSTRLVLVSGRPASDVARLLGAEPAPEIWGIHGAERRRDGASERRALPATEASLLDEAVELASRRLPAAAIERKEVAVAFHERGLPSDEAEAARGELEPALRDLVAGRRLELHRFDGGLEIRPAGIGKGDVVRRLVDEVGADAAIAYLGDDRTDEDAFVALAGRGLGVLVRPTLRPTRARAWLVPPDDLLAFLDRWIEVRDG